MDLSRFYASPNLLIRHKITVQQIQGDTHYIFAVFIWPLQSTKASPLLQKCGQKSGIKPRSVHEKKPLPNILSKGITYLEFPASTNKGHIQILIGCRRAVEVVCAVGRIQLSVISVEALDDGDTNG